MKHTLVKAVASVMSLSMLASAMPLANAANDPLGLDLEPIVKKFISHTGEECYVDCAEDADKNVWIGDLARKIYMTKANKSARKPGWPNMVSQSTLGWDTEAEVLKNAAAFYDYYCDVLGNTDFDILENGEGILYIVAANGELSDTMAVSDGVRIDYARGTSVQVPIVFFTTAPDGQYYNMGVDRGTVAHELTHLITGKALGWLGSSEESTETRALEEAYSDIIGELSEPEPDWLSAADAIKNNAGKHFSLRNIVNPDETYKPGYGKVEGFLTDYSEYLKTRDNLSSEGTPSFYRISTIISHAAYEMYAAGINKDELAKIWYASLNYYTGNTKKATLPDCCNAVCAAAKDYFNANYSARKAAAKLKIVENAFAAANLRPSHKTTQAEAEGTDFMADFVKKEQEKFPSGKYWNTGDPDTWSENAIKNDHTTSLPMGPTVRPFFGLLNWQTEEDYFQCAGFAKKLQHDYFGRTVMIQDDDPNYVPQIGDHLRLAHYMGSYKIDDKGHSVFVTAVDGDTITYADCNDGGDCVINWNKTMELTRNSEGKICIGSTRSYHDEFAWVERPLKQGDVNADGKIDNYDCWQLRYLVSGKADDVQENDIWRRYAADLNGDGRIDSEDQNLLYVLTFSPSAKNQYGFVAY